jgi:hypothetical protein
MLGFLFPSWTQQNVLIHGCSANEILQQRFKANNKATENFGTSYNIGLLSWGGVSMSLLCRGKGFFQ